MDLNDFLGPEPVVVNLRAEDRWQAIEELVNHLTANHKIWLEHRGAILASVKERESSMTTGIGFGIGIPHATTPLVADRVAALGRSRKGIQFDALDRKLVKVVFLFLLPAGQVQQLVPALAGIAKLLHSRHFREWLDGF